MADSGWITPTFRTGYSSATDVAYRLIGTICYLRGTLATDSGTVDFVADGVAFVLPISYRPTSARKLGTQTHSHTKGHGVGPLDYAVLVDVDGSVSPRYPTLDGLFFFTD